MKTSKKEVLKLAKKLLSASFTGRKLDVVKVRKNSAFIKRTAKSAALPILKLYLRLIRRFLEAETLLIESTRNLSPNQISSLKKYFEKSSGKSLSVETKIDPALLGGLKVTLGNTQWDLSVERKINQIREAFSGRYR